MVLPSNSHLAHLIRGRRALRAAELQTGRTRWFVSVFYSLWLRSHRNCAPASMARSEFLLVSCFPPILITKAKRARRSNALEPLFRIQRNHISVLCSPGHFLPKPRFYHPDLAQSVRPRRFEAELTAAQIRLKLTGRIDLVIMGQPTSFNPSLTYYSGSFILVNS